MPRSQAEPNRRIQIIVGILAIFAVGGILLILAIGRFLPGFAGEWFAALSGIVTTPFFMEASVAILGLLAVLTINHIRHRREGDECVYLEQIVDPAAENLPDTAKWAVYRDKPLPPEAPDLITRIEGAIAIGDTAQATELLSELPEPSLHHPEILRVRIALAEATGKDELAARLRQAAGDVPMN